MRTSVPFARTDLVLGLGVTGLVDPESCPVLNPVDKSALPHPAVAAVAVRRCRSLFYW